MLFGDEGALCFLLMKKPKGYMLEGPGVCPGCGDTGAMESCAIGLKKPPWNSSRGLEDSLLPSMLVLQLSSEALNYAFRAYMVPFTAACMVAQQQQERGEWNAECLAGFLGNGSPAEGKQLCGIHSGAGASGQRSLDRDFIAKHDLLENDITGRKAAERHERKLAQELQRICDCNRPHFKRLQVFGDVFEDICNSSLIFGDILKEVKNEYELYMVILLDSLPTTQYKTLMAQVKGMGKRPVKAQEIEEIRREIQTLVKKAKSVLERNEELRNELEIQLWVSQSPESKTVPETSGDHAMKLPEEKHLSLAAQIESMRCQVLAKWEEMQAIEKEIRETMTHAGMANTIEKTVKDIEAEALKLNSANSFLQHQIQEVQYNITDILNRQKVTQESQRKLWELLKKFLSLEDNEPTSDNSEECVGR
ncbi:armadillo repeat-containing protein 8-like [Platysternon megacephalum]|uniref:Armadillo repeat-containing protein 8-like n=1 Tax=Platysternon megacephalum TaxID=55544 RepID=A0A4D9EM63_9SAUR|nr:armadillo repeat-containing protein 8-like [Platysternon megacephalum]